MNKIIWVSSYPKSGNTWMRFLLSNYFFNKNNTFNYEIANSSILMFPQISSMKKIIDKNTIIQNPYNISKFWLKLQENLEIKNGNVTFLKNHNALVSIENNEFTNINFSLACIYIVRDPRDVVISYSHYKNVSYDKTIKDLCSNNLFYNLTTKENFPYVEILGSWKFNVNSWKNGIPKMPRIIIRYEDLLSNCYDQFYKVINFICDLMNIKLNEEKIKFSVENSRFEILKESEEKFGFKTNEGESKFFRSGKSEQWKDILSKSQIKKIEEHCKDEMKFLGYL